MHLRKVSIHVSLRNPRRLTWTVTFPLFFNFMYIQGPLSIMIQCVLQNGFFYGSIIRSCVALHVVSRRCNDPLFVRTLLKTGRISLLSKT